MARISSRTLFATTSPRTPEKMIPEITLLARHFTDQAWNPKSQRQFMELLREENFFNGQGTKDPAFSARDRINRSPKALGFVRLSPTIRLTPAGERLVSQKRVDEVLLRQLLKFQLPSPYHLPSKEAADFCVKPYLEILRLIRHMGMLRFDELQIFGLQLTDWHDFDEIVRKIELYRREKAQHKGSYKKFRGEYLSRELSRIFRDRIRSGNIRTRESREKSLREFLATQARNLRDYADAFFRYLRSTGLVLVSQVGKSLSIAPEKVAEVDYILEHTERTPGKFESEEDYLLYLGDASTPTLLSDDRDFLVERLSEEFPSIDVSSGATVEDLKDLLGKQREQRKEEHVRQEVQAIKDYKLYSEIQDVFTEILCKKYYDNPLMMEWNTWRAMTMLDGGEVKASLTLDDSGDPLSTAAGNQADIICDYGDFLVTVEVTLSTGQRQFEMEGEPVNRHLGKLKTSTGKDCYCLFIAPTISESTIAFFYSLHKISLRTYGGRSTIVPLPLSTFSKMIEDSYKATYTPNPSHIRDFFIASGRLAEESEDELIWYDRLSAMALSWLSGAGATR